MHSVRKVTTWKGKRIAVRAEESGTFEGTWLSGDCKDRFVTDGLQWPASVVEGSPAYHSGEDFDPLFGGDSKSLARARAKETELRRGRYNVSTVDTFVGTLRVRDQYFAECQEDGQMFGYGYGHLNAAPAELMLEAVLDIDVTPRKEPVNSTSDRCEPSNKVALCASATTLEDAAKIGCVEKVWEFPSSGLSHFAG